METKKTRATTLTARFGFQDHELTTPKHDELMFWLDGMIDHIIDELGRPEGKLIKTWEHAIASDETRIVRRGEKS